MPKHDLIVGDICRIVRRNPADVTNEGVLWRVSKLNGSSMIFIEPLWTPTGPSSRRRKKVHHLDVIKCDLIALGQIAQSLNDVIHQYLCDKGGNNEQGE